MENKSKIKGRRKIYVYPFVCVSCKRSEKDIPTLKHASKGKCVGCSSTLYGKAKREKAKIHQKLKVNLSKKDVQISKEVNAMRFQEVFENIKEFPYPVYSEEELKKDFESLRLNTNSIFNSNLIIGPVNGSKVANRFCKSRFEVSKKGKVSAIDAFENKESRQIIILKLLSTEEKEQKIFSKAKILGAIYRTNGVAFVSNFRPTIARFLYEKFCPENGTVYDFCGGFGGRLTGAAAAKTVKKYIGLEPNTKTFKELELLRDWLKSNGEVTIETDIRQSCAEEFCPEEYREQVDFAFSSPPYFDAEQYCKESTQSFVRYPSYGEWRSNFLKKTIENIFKLLKKDGVFAINIANTISATLEADTVFLAKSCGFVLEDVYQMKLREHSEGFAKTSAAEPIFIFRKRENA